MREVYCYVCEQRVKTNDDTLHYVLSPYSEYGYREQFEACSQQCVDRYSVENAVELAAAESVWRRKKIVDRVGEFPDTPEKVAYRDNLDQLWRGAETTPTERMFTPCWRHFGADWKSTAKTQAPGFADAARDFLERNCHMMAFIGPKSRGKTWASYGVIHGFMTHNYGKLWHTAQFIRWVELKIIATRCSSNFGPTANTAEEQMRHLQDVGLLVIDEFGLTKPLDNQLDHIHNLLDHRFVNGKWTLITSTRSLPELEEIMGGGIVDRFTGERTGGAW